MLSSEMYVAMHRHTAGCDTRTVRETVQVAGKKNVQSALTPQNHAIAQGMDLPGERLTHVSETLTC